jgi:predicted RNA-binding Zn ribbon-like protein
LAPGEDASPADRMAHRLQTADGSKTTFGILKSAIAGYESLVARTPTAYDLQFVFVAADPAAALAPVARAAAELLAESRSRSRVRKCANPECVRHFVDDSRTSRSRWCEMAVCGNRAKVTAFIERKRSVTPKPTSKMDKQT